MALFLQLLCTEEEIDKPYKNVAKIKLLLEIKNISYLSLGFFL